jgi:O-antigen/teichoic acid export membrane protein
MSSSIQCRQTQSTFLNDTAQLFGTSIVSLPMEFVSVIIVARALGPEGKGAYDLILATTGLLGIVLGFSIPSGITYVIARIQPNLRVLIYQLIGIAFLQSGIAGAVLLFVKLFRNSFFLVQLWTDNNAFFIVPIYLFFMTSMGYWRAVLIGEQKIPIVNARGLLAKVLQLAGLVGTMVLMPVFQQKPTPIVVVWILIGGAIIANYLYLQVLWLPHQISVKRSGLTDILRYSAPCYLGNLAQFLNYRLDVFLVGFFIDTKAVGIYALSASLAQMMWLLSNAAATGLLPRIASIPVTSKEGAMFAAKVTRLSFLISLITTILWGGCVYIGLVWVFGNAFRPGMAPFMFLLPGIVIFSFANTLAAYFAGIGKPQHNLAASFIGFIATVALDLFLIPVYGIVGAAMASTISYFISTAVIIKLFLQNSRLSLLSIIPTSADIGVIVAYARSLI